jgi:hypothetical protein
MKSLTLALLIFLLCGCGFQKPAVHDPVLWSTREATKAKVFEQLEAALRAEGLPISRVDAAAGVIVTDSFDVLPEYCDCGKNLVGQEYPGERRGVMKITIRQGDSTTVKFDFTTRLLILANNKTLICDSHGVLEDKLLSTLRQKPEREPR